MPICFPLRLATSPYSLALASRTTYGVPFSYQSVIIILAVHTMD
jgi:hypothetical protein